jgi:hypothetical protein
MFKMHVVEYRVLSGNWISNLTNKSCQGLLNLQN